MEEYWFLAPMLRLAISMASLNIFFLKLSRQSLSYVVRAKRVGRSMEKTALCKKATELPG